MPMDAEGATVVQLLWHQTYPVSTGSMLIPVKEATSRTGRVAASGANATTTGESPPAVVPVSADARIAGFEGRARRRTRRIVTVLTTRGGAGCAR